MKTKRDYRQPAMVVVGLQARNRLMAGSPTTTANKNEYTNGGTEDW